MSEYRDIDFALRDGVAVLTLDRPQKLNAFTGAMGGSLARAYRHCDETDAVRAVVLTGAGRAFCAGADLSPPEGGEAFAAPDPATFSAAGVSFPAFRVRKPVIAAVNGHAIGLGLTLALQCDVRFMAEEGKYGVVQARRGVMGDAYSHFTLPRLVGMARAADILLSGRTFRGDEALSLGIASRVLPAAEVLPTALDYARDIATHVAPLSAAVSKRLLWESLELSAEQVERKETALHLAIMGQPDAIEGPLAFLQKRDPAFRGSVSTQWPAWPPTDPPDAG